MRDHAIVEGFSELMRHELNANEHKGDWTEATNNHRIYEVFYHALKLAFAVNSSEVNKTYVRELAADVANEAMFLADVCGALDDDVPETDDGPLMATTLGMNFFELDGELREFLHKCFNLGEDDMIPTSATAVPNV